MGYITAFSFGKDELLKMNMSKKPVGSLDFKSTSSFKIRFEMGILGAVNMIIQRFDNFYSFKKNPDLFIMVSGKISIIILVTANHYQL